MRILIVCGSFPSRPGEDPVAPAHAYLARALKNLGHEIVVLSFCTLSDKYASEGVYDYHGITVHHLYPHVPLVWNRGLSIPTFAFHTNQAYILHKKFADVVGDFNPDVIDCHEYNALGFYFARDHKYPLVVHCYGPLAHLMRSGDCGLTSPIDEKLVDLAELAPIAEADRVIACAADIAARASRRCGRPLSEFEIIKVPITGCDNLPNRSEAVDVKAFPRIFNFGRVERQKGADLLLNSLPAIAKRFPDFHLTIGGSEPTEYGSKISYAEYMRQQINEFGLSDRVTFLNQLSREQIKQNVIDSDICVFPSQYETAGYSCLEAVSYGGAVVATAVGGLPEYHKHGESAWLIPPNSSQELAKGIIKLAEDDDLRNKLKSHGFDYCEKLCNPANIGASTVAVYQQAIDIFAARSTVNRPFQLMSEMIVALTEQHEPLALPQNLSPAPAQPIRPPDGANDAANIVKTLGEMVLGHLSRVWKEGYEAGFDEGRKQAIISTSTDHPSTGSLLFSTARKLKRKLRSLSNNSSEKSD